LTTALSIAKPRPITIALLYSMERCPTKCSLHSTGFPTGTPNHDAAQSRAFSDGLYGQHVRPALSAWSADVNPLEVGKIVDVPAITDNHKAARNQFDTARVAFVARWLCEKAVALQTAATRA
jgi:hypothetical protein